MPYDPKKRSFEYPLSYRGNVLWPIVFLFLFPPVGILLILLNTSFRKGNLVYFLHYRGSEAWLIAWTLLFFPIAIALAIFNGFDVIELAD
ncbi:MAG: hypothetical protein ACXU9U_01455 [Parachlamydiaceae bacterium]